MSMSTPITQLPSFSHGSMPQQPSQQSPQFINEQQRHIVTQAQNAANQFKMPLSTTTHRHPVYEDDATIQEALQLASGSDTTAPLPPAAAQLQTPTYPPHVSDHGYAHVNAAPNAANAAYPADLVYGGPAVGGGYGMSGMPGMPGMPSSGADVADAGFASFLLVAEDIKIAAFAVVLLVVLELIPARSLVTRYIMSMDNVPHADLVIKAILVGAVVFLTPKLLRALT